MCDGTIRVFLVLPMILKALQNEGNKNNVIRAYDSRALRIPKFSLKEK